MSDLRPRGITINIAGVERHFLFTFAAIDEIQDHFDKPLVKVLEMLKDDRTLYKAAGYIVCTLINDEIARTGSGRGPELMEVMRSLDIQMTARIVRTILKAYGISMPEPDEDDEPDDPEDIEQLNIARMIYIGMTKLGYTEAEVMDMTPRKFHLIYDEYLEMNGGKTDTGGGIDDLP